MATPTPPTARRAGLRTCGLAVLLLATLSVVGLVLTQTQGTATASTTRSGLAIGSALGPLTAPAPRAAAAPVTPWFGLLGAQDDQITALAHQGGVGTIAVAAGWGTLEPTSSGLNADRVAALRARIRSIVSQGYSVVLDPGLQYPPAWAFSLPGQTRFVDQFGDAWHATLSQDVPNAVFNTAVRAAIGSYLADLGTALSGVGISRVRIGGLLSGELRYPLQSYNGHSNLIWAYDPSAQRAAPVPGWKPGSGSASDAARMLQWYFDQLTGYLTWQMRTVRAAFPTQSQEVLLPSWGLRPGMVDAAIAAGMHGTTNAEVNGMIANGLDWVDQVKAIAATGIPAYLSSTWLDAPQQSTTVAGIAPIAYLAQLARPYGLGLMGENTGGGGEASLKLSLSRVKQFGLAGMWYMSGSLIAQGKAGVTLSQMNAEAKAARS